MKITLSDAIKSVLYFVTGKNPPETIEERIEEDVETDHLKCLKCNNTLDSYNQYNNDKERVLIYKCNNCEAIKEIHYDKNNEIIRDINIFSKFPSNSSSYLEILNSLEYNQFALDRLWVINGKLCFPVLLKTDVDDSLNLIFASVGSDLMHEDVKCYILNNSNIISEAILSRMQTYSYFFNPYLSHLPFPDLNFKINYTHRGEAIQYASDIRYQHKIQKINNRIVHKLYIVKDYPILNYGIELYVKFLTYDNSEDEEPIKDLIIKLDLESLILGKESFNIDINYSIQSSHILMVNEYSLCKKSISQEQRISLFEDIKQFFDNV